MKCSFRIPDEEDWRMGALVAKQKVKRILAGDPTPVTPSTVLRELVWLHTEEFMAPELDPTAPAPLADKGSGEGSPHTEAETGSECTADQEKPVSAPVQTSNWDPEGGRPINPDPLEAATGGLSADDVAALLDGIV